MKGQSTIILKNFKLPSLDMNDSHERSIMKDSWDSYSHMTMGDKGDLKHFFI